MKNKEFNKFSRRDFIKVSSLGGSGLLLANNLAGSAMNGSNTKTKYAIVGMGSRAAMWQRAIMGTHNQTSEMVGFCDNNEGRLKLYQENSLKNLQDKCY